MPSDLETAQLRAFVTSVRAGSISRAATALGQTQSALSQKLRRLERRIGRPLLHRAPSGVSLTRTGEALLPYAERILALSAEAQADAGRTLSGHCGVGLVEDLVAARLPQLLADFARLHPRATLEVVVASGPAMRRAFEQGRVQIALCDTSYLPEPPRWSLHLPLVWAVGPGVDLREDPLPLVLFSQPCRWRASVLESLDAAGRPWRVAFESTSLAGVQAAVRAGLGAAPILPANLESGSGTPVGNESLPALPSVEVGIVRRPGTEGEPLVDAVDLALRRMT
jgi:DNA-binding transcriptional LysR family regulator